LYPRGSIFPTSIFDGVRNMKVRSVGGSRRSAGVSPAVAGASRSRSEEVLTSWEEKQIETEGEVHEGAGRMPAPQRARRLRYTGQNAHATAGETPALHPVIGLQFYVTGPFRRSTLGYAARN
jgi:hypothetical protein